MKIQCPLCQQQGKASDSLEGKKVRCPACEKVFRVTGTTLMPQMSQEVGTIAMVGGEAIPEGVSACSKCGFSFSQEYLQKVDSKILCAACVA